MARGYIPFELLTVLSLDFPANAEEPDGISLGDMIPDTAPSPEDILYNKELREEIGRAFAKMRPNERRAIVLHCQGFTLEEIGDQMGVCRERVRQWEMNGRRVARGEPRYELTQDYKTAEARRRKAARDKYATDPEHRRRETERARAVREREREGR